MSAFVEAVVQFNQEILCIAQREIGNLEPHELSLSKKCLAEELSEFIEAAECKDITGQVDAIIDLMYFAIGVLYKLGLSVDQINKCCMAVHNANMSKKRGVNAKRATGAADAIKPEGWVAPEVRISSILFDTMIAK